jgi:hypothetical protein
LYPIFIQAPQPAAKEKSACRAHFCIFHPTVPLSSHISYCPFHINENRQNFTFTGYWVPANTEYCCLQMTAGSRIQRQNKKINYFKSPLW